MDLTEIIVECGNGGDYEYYVDVYRWHHWIEQNIANCLHNRDFFIVPHTQGNQAIIRFVHPEQALIFSIIKPPYVDPRQIDWDIVAKEL